MGIQMAKRNIRRDPKRLNKKPAAIKMISRLRKGLSRFTRSICGLFLLRKRIPAKRPTNANKPAANSTGWMILKSG